jgi:hypothetical protein
MLFFCQHLVISGIWRRRCSGHLGWFTRVEIPAADSGGLVKFTRLIAILISFPAILNVILMTTCNDSGPMKGSF